MSEIDVSKCDRYNDFHVKRGVSQYAICLASFEQWGGADQKFCKDRPNCYYKQLQQLKQENEELKEKLKQADEDIKSECTRCALTNLLEDKLENINLLAQSLYYHSITDPVKRAEAIDEIIILAGGR